MTYSQFIQVCYGVVEIIKNASPIDTGNLRWNAIRFTLIDQNTFKISIDENIAPYTVYTNEPWISPKWNGAKNPNEAWWNNVIENKIVNYLATVLNAKVVKGE